MSLETHTHASKLPTNRGLYSQEHSMQQAYNKGPQRRLESSAPCMLFSKRGGTGPWQGQTLGLSLTVK